MNTKQPSIASLYRAVPKVQSGKFLVGAFGRPSVNPLLRFSAKSLITAAACFFALTCQAQGADEMLIKLRRMYPSTRIDRVVAAPTAGLFEVSMGPNMAYIDGTGRYWLFGNIWDMQERRDITAPRKASLDKIDPGSLPLQSAIKSVYGNGKRVVYVFADPNCGYCKVFEKEVQKLSDTTVYTFVVPMLSEDSVSKAQAIWCSPDRARAWRDWMQSGKEPQGRDCDAPGESLIKVATALRVSGTPTIFSADGRRKSGAMPLGELVAWLDESATVAITKKTTVSERQ
jgi:thiol:disulfide interchange protein DsbC